MREDLMAANIRTEFSLAVPHRPGILAQLLDALAEADVNVLAMCGWGEEETGEILFVPDDEEKARKALAAAGFHATTSPVLTVTVPSGRGAGAKLASRLSKAGINIEYVYATTSGSGPSTAVFGVSDSKAALAALK